MASSIISLILKGEDQGASSAVGALTSGLGSMSGLLAGGVVAAAGAAAVALGAVGVATFNLSSDIHQATNDMQAQFGLTREEAEGLADVATGVFANNFGGSMEEAAAGVAVVRTQMDRFGEMSEAELGAATEAAFALQDAFGADMEATTGAANNLMKNFGLTSQGAFDFISGGMQNGLNASGDFLETINEYSVQFADGGASAAEFFSVMDTGMQNGMLGTDKAADTFKEFRLRIQDGSDSTAEALAAIGLNVDDVTAGLNDGSLSVMDVFQQVQTGIAGADSQTVAFNAGVALMGSQFEDLGETAIGAIDPLSSSLGDLAGSTDSLNVQYDNFGSMLEGVKRQALVAFTPLTDAVLGMINDYMPQIQAAMGVFSENLVVAGIAIGAFVTGYVIPFVQEHGPAILEIWQLVWGGIQEVTRVAVEVLGPYLADFFGVVEDLFTNRLGVVKEIFEAFGAAFQGDWVAFGANLREAWDLLWQGTVDFFSGVWDMFRPIVDNLITNMFGSFEGKDWTEISRQIINGMITGLNNGRDAVINTLLNIASGAIDAFKGFFGIESPSRLMAGLFVNILEGGGVGMDRQTPALLAQARGVAGAVSGALTPDQIGIPIGVTGGQSRLSAGSPLPQLGGGFARQSPQITIEKIEINDTRAMEMLLAFLRDYDQRLLLENIG